MYICVSMYMHICYYTSCGLRSKSARKFLRIVSSKPGDLQLKTLRPTLIGFRKIIHRKLKVKY